MHRAQLFLRELLVMMTFVGRHLAGECRGNTQKPDQFAHGAPQSEFIWPVEAEATTRPNALQVGDSTACSRGSASPATQGLEYND